MTTVAELKKFLEQFPDDTTVEVLCGAADRYGNGDSFGRVDMSLAFDGENSYRGATCTRGTSWEFNSFKVGKNILTTLFLGQDG